MFGFFKGSKSDAKIKNTSLPPIPLKRDDELSRTADLVQSTGDCAKADGEGFVLMFRSGILQPHQFFPTFLKSEVFMLAKDLNELNAPLFLDGSDGAPLLAIFTSVERAKRTQEKRPEFRFAAQVNCGQVLSSLPQGVGVVLNPESEAVTLQMSSVQFERFRANFLPR